MNIRFALLSSSMVLVFGAGACGPPREASDAAEARQASAVARLDAGKVPEELRALVPLAQEWGIGDDVERGVKVDRARPEERERVRAAVAPHQRRITAWLDSFGKNPMSDEAAAFMYLQLAIEEMP
jgi:hypothetical protein